MPSSDNERGRYDSDGEKGDRGGSPDRGSDNDDNELASRSLRIQSKRYYIDVKQNQRGRFIKLVEGLPNGKKNRLSFPMFKVPDVRDKLTAFAQFWKDMESNGGKDDEASEEDNMKSDVIRSENQTFYFDLKENRRGVFLRIASTSSHGGARQILAIPAEGMIEICD